ncbi:hypothetical protein HY638_01530 [Candidatus Woesearchaeota archaeon]|nr:hypothetical protein [Candidatus Woesearchaeota archaeon]
MNDMNVPVYVKVNDYREVAAAIDSIKNRLSEARQALGRLKELKEQEDSELQSWEATVADAESKVDEIEGALAQQ